MKTLLNARHAHVILNSEWNCVWTTFKGYATPEEYRKTIDKVLEGVLRHNVPFTVADARDQAIVNKEDIGYTASQAQKMTQAGVRHHIIIQPESFFTKQSVKNFKNETDKMGNYTIHNVSTEDEVHRLIEERGANAG